MNELMLKVYFSGQRAIRRLKGEEDGDFIQMIIIIAIVLVLGAALFGAMTGLFEDMWDNWVKGNAGSGVDAQLGDMKNPFDTAN